MTREILARIEPELARAELTRLASRMPKSLDAWSLYRRAQGTLTFKPWDEEAFAEVVELLEEAIERDASFALAHAFLALMEAFHHMLGFGDGAAAKARVLDAVDKALRLDERSSAVLGFAGCALVDIHERHRGVQALERAIELDPSNAQAWVAYGTTLLSAGDVERAVECLDHGMRLSPLDARLAFWGAILAAGFLRLDRVEDALATARQACRAGSNNYVPRIVLALAASKAGADEEARAAIEDAWRLRPTLTPDRMAWLIGEDGVRHLRQHGLLVN